MANKRSSFRDKVAFNSSAQKSKAANYGYLSLPNNVPVFKEEPDSRVQLDFVPYIVTDDNHLDKDAERDVAVKGSQWYRRPYRLHRNVGAENNSYVCPTSVGRGKCPICEYKKKLIAEGADFKDDSVKQLNASARSIYYVIPKNDKKLDDKPHIWDISHFCFQDALNDEMAEDAERGMFPDLQDGLTLRIRFSEETFAGNKFAKTSRIDFEPRDYTYDDKLVEELTSLDDVLVVKSYKELSDLFFESGEEAPTTGERPKTETRPREDRAERTERTERPRDDEKPRERERPKAADEPPAEPPKSSFTRAKPGTTGKPAEQKPAEKPTASSAPAGECPHGHRFGKDNDKFDECESCKVWSKCCDSMEAAA